VTNRDRFVTTAAYTMRRLPAGYARGLISLILGLCLLTGCGVTRGDRPAARAVRTGATTRAMQPPLLFLTLGSRVMSRLVAGIGAGRRDCPEVRISPLNGGAPMEIDIFGANPLGCAVVVAQLRRARRQLRQGLGGPVSGWRCVWTPLPAIGCRRGGSLLAASNPGG
jgi:hypothetical protein